MALYPYETQLVLNSNASSVLVTDAVVTIYDPSDTDMTTPLTLVDMTGSPLPNPLPVTHQGFLPAFQTTIPQVLWSGGGYYGYLSSYRGLLDQMTAAKTEATNAAFNALNAKVAAEAAAASAAAPTDSSVDAGITRAGAVAKWKAATAYQTGQYVVNPDGFLVKALLSFTSGSTYDATKWSAPAAAAAGTSSGGATNYVVQNTTTGIIPARPTSDPNVLVFWICWTQPTRVTTGTGGAYPNDVWLQRTAP